MPRKLLLLLAFVLLATSVQAQTRARKSDFYFSPTFVNSQAYTFEGGSTLQTDTGYGFELGWHHNFDAHWSAGLEFGWRIADLPTFVEDREQGACAPGFLFLHHAPLFGAAQGLKESRHG